MDEPALDRLETEVARARHRARMLVEQLRGSADVVQAPVAPLASLEVTVDQLGIAAAELLRQRRALLAAQDELRAERARYRDLFDAAPDAYLEIDASGIVRDANRAATGLLRLDARSLSGCTIAAFVDREDRERLREFLDVFARGATNDRITVRMGPGEGERVHVEISASIVRSPSGAVEGLRCIARDVTERVRAEARIRALAGELEERVVRRTAQLELAAHRAVEALDQERRARTEADRAHDHIAFLASAGAVLGEALDLAPVLASSARLAVPQVADLCAVAVVAGDGHLVLEVAHDDPALEGAARALRDLTGEGPSEAFGLRRVLHAWQPSSLPAEDEGAATEREIRVTRDIAQDDVGSFLTLPLVAGGRSLGAMVLAVGARHESGSFPDEALIEAYARRVAAAVDKAQLHAELRAAYERTTLESERKSKLFAVLSHEIRTPLQSIGGYTELLRLGVHGALSVKQAEDLDRIQTSHDYLLRIVDDALEVARLERGKLRVIAQPVPVAEALASASAIAERLFAEHGIGFRCQDCDRRILAFADPERLQQILLNLLTNAARYTARGGEAALEWEATGNSVYLHVRDTGRGIEAEVLQSIFEPYLQLERTGPASHGMGLGLSLSREFARAMGGELTVESTPGRGSVFTLRLQRSSGTDPVSEERV